MDNVIEKLLFYIILIKSRFISKDTYIKYLDEVFMENSDDNLLFELEICFGDIYKSEKKIYEYMQSENRFDYEVLEKMLFEYLKDFYKNIKAGSQQEKEDFIYSLCYIYKFLPEVLQEKEPFNELCDIDDILYDEDYLYYCYESRTTDEVLNKLFDV